MLGVPTTVVKSNSDSGHDLEVEVEGVHSMSAVVANNFQAAKKPSERKKRAKE